MARIRSVHPSQWTDEEFVACSFPARLLAIALRNEADDNGVFEWKPVGLKMKLMPADNVDVGALLEELVQSRQVLRFEAGGKAYGAVRNFCRFQRPKKPKAVHPITDDVRKWVGLDGSSTGDGSEPDEVDEDVSSEPVRNSFGTGSEISPQMEDGGGNKEEEQPPIAPQGAASAAPSPSRDEIGEEFEDLWRAYGGNSARGKATNPKAPALDRYRRIRKSGVPAERILAGAKGYVAAMEDCGKHGTEYTKQLVAWLNQRLWEQYADPDGDDSDSPATRAMEAALARGEREVATRIFRLRQAGQHREADDEGRRYLGEAA